MRPENFAVSVGCLITCLAVVGCGGEGRSDPFASDTAANSDGSTSPVAGDDAATGTAGGSTTAPDSADNGNETADDTAGAVFDVGSGPTSTSGPTTEACAKVDVLYVIDNSPSMYEEQQTLIANFGTFAADMQDALVDVQSYHIGVITTDDYQNSGGFDDGANTVNQSFAACQSLGGLVVEAQAGSCLAFADGGNFITEADDLATKFECIANVGEDGDSDEKVGDALMTFLGSQFIANDVSDCNEGFLRNDALLVIVILTDENDSSNPGPAEWFQSVVAAKGVAENVVVLSLIWEESANGCNDAFSEVNGTEIIAFTEMFPNHSLGNICDNSYAGFFSATLPLIEAACQEFEPEG